MSKSETELEFSLQVARQNKKTRFYFSVSAVIVVFGIVSFMLPLGRYSEIFAFYQGIWGAMAVAGGALFGAFAYLQSGSNRGPDLAVLLSREMTLATERIEELETKLNNISSESPATGILPDRSSRDALIDSLKEMVGAGAIAEIFDAKTAELRASILQQAKSEQLQTSFRAVSRIEREIRDLRLRSNLNLLIGMSITFLGLYLLWQTVGEFEQATVGKVAVPAVAVDLLKDILLPIIPRFSLVIFIEIFAFFFLRLYRDGLSEIKYFQNELTNIESKMIAVEVALASSDNDSLKTALDSLAKTERHFILQKGQTTVELERAKSESELTRNLLKALPDIFKNKNS